MGGVCLIAYLCIFFNIVPYNQNKMSNWYFQLPDLKDGDYIRLDLEQVSNQQKKVSQLVHSRGKNQQNPSPTFLPSPEQDIPTRSIKTKGGEYQISFQAGFMDEHQSAFKKQTQNFVESSFKQIQRQILGFKIFDKLHWRSHSAKRLNTKEKTQFQKDKQTQQKLTKFLKMIQDSQCEDVYFQLQYLALLGWENYLIIRDQRLSENQLIEKAENFAKEDYQKIFEESGIKFLNFEVIQQPLLNSREVIKQAFQRFVRFFYTTIFLVVQEYFGNPYGEIQEAKRSRPFYLQEDLQDDFSSSQSSNFYRNLPHKKLPYSQ